MSIVPEVSDPKSVLVSWFVPGAEPETTYTIDAVQGQATVVVGANGTGKSALGMWLDSNTQTAPSRRLIAHRRLWFSSSGPEISSGQRASMGQNMRAWGLSPESRYLDHADSQRASIVLFDLLALLNSENGRIADLAMAGSTRRSIELEVGQRILDRLNDILGGSGLPVRVTLAQDQTFVAMNVRLATQYPIHQMSDGEKSAILLAAEVMSAPRGSVLIIDEPERHLHRSISAGLVEAILSDRPDCHFVILTHDLDLAARLEGDHSRTYVLTGCVWSGSQVSGWSLESADPASGVPEHARRAILGGRRDILFIEGGADSLDVKLYRLLFPGWSLVPAGGADQVMRAVTGLKASEAHHWVRARGVVDGDGRSDDERAALLSRGVLTLPVSEVENLYYIDDVRQVIAATQAASLERSAAEMNMHVRDLILETFREKGILERLSEKLAMSELRRKVFQELLEAVDLKDEAIALNIPSPYAAVLVKAQGLLETEDTDALVRLLPIRDTALRGRVAVALGYQKVVDYEAAVRVHLRSNSGLVDQLREILGRMPDGL